MKYTYKALVKSDLTIIVMAKLHGEGIARAVEAYKSRGEHGWFAVHISEAFSLLTTPFPDFGKAMGIGSG